MWLLSQVFRVLVHPKPIGLLWTVKLPNFLKSSQKFFFLRKIVLRKKKSVLITLKEDITRNVGYSNLKLISGNLKSNKEMAINRFVFRKKTTERHRSQVPWRQAHRHTLSWVGDRTRISWSRSMEEASVLRTYPCWWSLRSTSIPRQGACQEYTRGGIWREKVTAYNVNIKKI